MSSIAKSSCPPKEAPTDSPGEVPDNLKKKNRENQNICDNIATEIEDDRSNSVASTCERQECDRNIGTEEKESICFNACGAPLQIHFSISVDIRAACGSLCRELVCYGAFGVPSDGRKAADFSSLKIGHKGDRLLPRIVLQLGLYTKKMQKKVVNNLIV